MSNKFIITLPKSIFKNKSEIISNFFFDTKKANIIGLKLLSIAVLSNKNKKTKTNIFTYNIQSSKNIKFLKISKMEMNKICETISNSSMFNCVVFNKTTGDVTFEIKKDLVNEKFYTINVEDAKTINSNQAFIGYILTQVTSKKTQYFNVYFMIIACKFKRTSNFKDAKRRIKDMFEALVKSNLIKSVEYNTNKKAFVVVNESKSVDKKESDGFKSVREKSVKNVEILEEVKSEVKKEKIVMEVVDLNDLIEEENNKKVKSVDGFKFSSDYLKYI